MPELELTGFFDSDSDPPEATPERARTGDTPPASTAPTKPDRGAPVAWKAAASSVPRLREQPAADPAAVEAAVFPGFAQDEGAERPAPRVVETSSGPVREAPLDGPRGAPPPLSVEPRFWEIWLDRILAVPRPILLGSIVGLVIVVAAALLIRPGEEPHVPLARLRQQPEAFDGQLVTVRGKAGEAFTIGGSYVFNLRQGRDTIVVYSRSRPPALNRDVRATGTVIIGYLDGLPRVALFETPATP